MSHRIELFRPSVPKWDQYRQYLEMMDKNAHYSNFGPLHELFSTRLAEHFCVDTSQLQLFNSGTFALVAALHSLKKVDRKYCLLPSWTFVATAQAVVEAGLTPVFLDVDFESMQLTAQELNQVPKEILEQTSVAIIVSPFGAPLILNGIQEFKQKFDIEILCDCAAGFESLKKVDFPTVISLHATKTFGIGEGGLLLSQDGDLIKNSKAYSNFGFMGERRSKSGGINGKLSEMHCAVGLGLLDVWGETRNAYYESAGNYLNELGDTCHFQKGWGADWVSSTCVMRLLNKKQKEGVRDDLASQGIASRDWWNGGCHLEPFFEAQDCIGQLVITRELARNTLGVPFYKGISAVDTLQVGQIIRGCI